MTVIELFLLINMNKIIVAISVEYEMWVVTYSTFDHPLSLLLMGTRRISNDAAVLR